MGGRLFLGNQMISPVIIQGEEKVFNVDVNDWLGEINAQGELVESTKDINVVFDGVNKIDSAVLEEKFEDDERIKSVSFPDLEVIGEDASFYYSFFESGLESFTAPKLKRIELNDQNFEGCFTGSELEILSFPELEFINDSGFSYSCGPCRLLKTVSFPKLKNVSTGAFDNSFVGSSALESVDLSALETAGNSAFRWAFNACSALISAYFDSLKTIGPGCFYGAFRSNTSLTVIRFPLLDSVGSGGFYEAFRLCASLNSLYFNSLNANSFGSYTNQFQNMLSGCSNVTVHFPVGLDATIGNWSDVLAGFGGTNTTILYDL